MKKITTLIAMLAFSMFANAQTWTVIPSGTTNILNSVSCGTATTVFVTGINKTLLKSSNGGLSFSPVASFATGNEDFTSCFFNNSDTGYVAGGDFSSWPSGGFIYRTVNGGTSWTQVSSGLLSAFNDITFPGPQYGYAVGGEAGTGIIYKSNDYGQTWSPIYNSGIIANLLTSASFINNTDGYVAGNDESSFESKLITINGASVSNNQNFSAYTLFTDVYFKTIDTGFVTANGSANYILKTTNGGATWNPVYTGVALRSITFSDSQTGWAVGAGGVILKSVNGGNTWATVPSPVTVDLRSITFANPDHGIIAGDNGTILRWNGINTGISDFNSAAQGLSIYPNPAAEQLMVQFNADKNYVIEIYDLQGAMILSKVTNSETASINTSNISPGIYFLRVSEGEKLFIRKLVIQ